MKELKEFVDRENHFAKLFKGKILNLSNAQDRQAIAGMIDSALSPENLHCDGEISRAEAMRKFRRLEKAALQLLKLDPSVKIYEYC